MKSPRGSHRCGFLVARRPYKVAGDGDCGSGGSRGAGGDGKVGDGQTW